MAKWSANDIPRLDGKLAVVTGATGGIGFETALGLARNGADTVLTGRDSGRGSDALRRIGQRARGAEVRFAVLDMASLGSITAFAGRMATEARPLDILVNNAGVMALPGRQESVDGFELQLGTNYLGHFALTGRLLPLLRQARAPRVVSLASNAHRRGRIDFDDLQGKRYRPWKAYEQSKLAMLIFARELQRRSDDNGWGVASIAAHPGWANTDIVRKGPASEGRNFIGLLAPIFAPLVSQSAAAGAWPILYAATASDARPGGYYGPDGLGEIRGAPAPARISPAAMDDDVATRLWTISEDLTGVRYDTKGQMN